ncbi:MAG: HAD family hydrolase [Deltaproteobacteria bacterium]|nr:HAD family hydrolase [Deltaproteobacteria bacterium]
MGEDLANIHISNKAYDVDLVIFDKDGTLLDFRGTWIAIIREFLMALGKRVQMHKTLKKRIEKALGMFIDSSEIDGYGPIAMGTFAECDTLLVYSLYCEGLRWDKAKDIVREAGMEVFTGEVRRQSVKPAQGSIEILKKLKAKGLSVAIATNDTAKDATSDMQIIGAFEYIDLIIGADSVDRSKPNPDMIYKICEHFGTTPKRSIMIGDTIMDALMGKNAGVGLTIGVCGLLPRDVLEEYTDVVVSSLAEIQ